MCDNNGIKLASLEFDFVAAFGLDTSYVYAHNDYIRVFADSYIANGRSRPRNLFVPFYYKGYRIILR